MAINPIVLEIFQSGFAILVLSKKYRVAGIVAILLHVMFTIHFPVSPYIIVPFRY